MSTLTASNPRTPGSNQLVEIVSAIAAATRDQWAPLGERARAWSVTYESTAQSTVEIVTSTRSSAAIDEAKPVDASVRLEQLKDTTGLTWDQIARAFGVSKRAVLHWKSGGSMSSGHEERLASLLSDLHHAGVTDPEAGRAWLMTLGPDGMSPWQQWVESARRDDPRAAWIDRQPDPAAESQ